MIHPFADETRRLLASTIPCRYGIRKPMKFSHLLAPPAAGRHTRLTPMTPKYVGIVCTLGLCLACGRPSNRTGSNASASASAMHASSPRASAERAPSLPEPTRLAKMAISAYNTSLALDDEAVYLLTTNAAYRLVAGQPQQGIELDLGIGATLTQSAFIFWSKGAIWSAPKQGGVTRQLARFPHQLQYFVASGESFAWVDRSDDGLYTIQTLSGRRPRILVSFTGEISALNMIGELVYFVHRPTDGSWRIGSVRITGGEPAYSTERKGRTPAMLTGSDYIYYYDVDKSEIQKLLPDLHQEELQLEKFVCSPINVASRIYCGCVEGLFEVSKEDHKPRVLMHGRRGSITNIRSNSKLVAWTFDAGPEMLAVDMLPVVGLGDKAAAKP